MNTLFLIELKQDKITRLFLSMYKIKYSKICLFSTFLVIKRGTVRPDHTLSIIYGFRQNFKRRKKPYIIDNVWSGLTVPYARLVNLRLRYYPSKKGLDLKIIRKLFLQDDSLKSIIIFDFQNSLFSEKLNSTTLLIFWIV